MPSLEPDSNSDPLSRPLKPLIGLRRLDLILNAAGGGCALDGADALWAVTQFFGENSFGDPLRWMRNDVLDAARTRACERS